MQFNAGIVAVEQFELVLNAAQAVAATHFVGKGRAVVVDAQVQRARFLVNPYVDPARVGSTLRGLVVRDIADLEAVVAEHGITIAVLTTPASVAQEICDRLVAAGITSILNFAPGVLAVPDGVDVRKVDLSIELQILAYHQQRKANLLGGVS